ncbi:MAG TPA: tetratricopeptide repeat protein [Candidatus Krumholzibacteriaceae bacterium]|nr:tetratricopeptide repeat protein [Candidatus Krumholzibacteriaceae bacterium]
MVRNNIFKLTLSAVLISLLLLSCGQDSVIEKVEKEYKDKNYKQVVFLVRHHIRRGGRKDPKLLLLAAESLLKLGAESEAEEYFSEIYKGDSARGPEIASILQEKAIKYMDQGSIMSGRRFIIQAVSYNPNITFGQYDLEAGKFLMKERKFDKAINFFSRYLGSYADSSGSAEAMLNLGFAYKETGRIGKAIDTFRALIFKYPVSRFVSTARWNYENLSIEQAEKAIKAGEFEEAKNILILMKGSSTNTLNLVRANFMLGDIFAGQNFIGKAIDSYKEVLNLNLGSSGRYSERAKERIEELEELR